MNKEVLVSNPTGVLEAVPLSGVMPAFWIILLFRVRYCVRRRRLTRQRESDFCCDISTHNILSVLHGADARGFSTGAKTECAAKLSASWEQRPP